MDVLHCSPILKWSNMKTEPIFIDRKSTRLNSSHRLHLVCRLLLEKKNFVAAAAFGAAFPYVSINEAKALARSRKAVIIDVNGSESYAKGQVPCAFFFKGNDANRDLPLSPTQRSPN